MAEVLNRDENICRFHDVQLLETHECLLCMVVEECPSSAAGLSKADYKPLKAAYDIGRQHGQEEVYKRI